MRKKQARVPVTSEAVNQAVTRAVGDAVHRALHKPVYRVGNDSVGWAMFLIVDGAVDRAVKGAMNQAVAQPKKPPHPGLKFYLAEVAR